MAILKRLQNKIANYLNARKDRALMRKHNRSFFTDDQINPIIKRNRDTLASIPRLIDPEVYEASIFQYGIPKSLKHLIDAPLKPEATYTDAICFLTSQMKSPINYLELGVSVGKNFFQIANFLKDSSLTGFDIEEINPILESRLSGKTVVSRWPTKGQSMKGNESSLTSYHFLSNQITYLSGDIFDEGSWARLEGKKYNVIFSDAFHSPEALRFEYEMMKRYRLIAEEQFVMMWDDLGGAMTREFFQIYESMRQDYGLTPANLSLNAYRGWIGDFVPKHMIGMLHRI